MKTWLAVLAGLFLIIVGTGFAGANAAFLLGIGLFGYNLAVLVSLALRESIERLADLFEAWAEWEPNQTRSAWYGRPEQYKVLAPASRHTWHYANQTKGQSLLEYALILALVFVVAVVGLAIFGEGLAELFDNTIGVLREAYG